MADTNPLNSFFRKSKFNIDLPSRGRWYPKTALAPTVVNGSVAVFPMTAADEAKFKIGDATLTGAGIFDLVRSCVPEIRQPELAPMADLDAILLAIRRASYGDNMKFNVKVPQTTLMREITLNLSTMASESFGSEADWDDTLEITDEDTGKVLIVKVKPISLKTLFGHSKTLVRVQQMSVKMAEADDIADDAKLESLTENIQNLSQVNITMVADSIESLETEDFSTRNPADVRNLLGQIDVAYFNEMQKHIDDQRKKIGLQDTVITSTPEEIEAGAPETWVAEINFTTAEFFK